MNSSLNPVEVAAVLEVCSVTRGAVGYHRLELEDEHGDEDLARLLHRSVTGLEATIAERHPDLASAPRQVTVVEYSGPRPAWVIRVWVERPE